MTDIDYDGFIIQHDPLDAYTFSGMNSFDEALDYMYKYCTTDFQHTAVFTPNENGEGARIDANTIWIVFTSESLPKKQFTKLKLSADGVEKRDAKRAGIAADKQALADSLAAANNQSSNTSS